MASLTETAYQTRRAINWSVIVFISYFILRFFWSLLIAFWIAVFPPQAAPPNHAFQQLPKLAFPTPESTPPQLTFRLETISGSLPRMASDSARIYFMPKQAPDLLALEKTRQFAARLNFSTPPTGETKTIYRFDDSDSPIRKLRYDIVSDNFIMQYQYQQDMRVFTEGTLRDTDKINADALQQLQNLGLYRGDFLRGPHIITLLHLKGNTLEKTENLSETDAMRVDFFRGSVNTLAVKTPHPDEGEIRLLYSPSRDAKRHLLELVYTYWPIDYQTYATYPIIPIAQAWQQVQNGQGYIAAVPNNGDTAAVIRKAYLAYYDSFDPQTYLQPIYVFEGDFGVSVYVPAVSPEWTEK